MLPGLLHKFRHVRGALVWGIKRREGCGFFERVCAFMNFRQVPLSAGLWESACSTVSATVSGCVWRRLAGVIRWVSTVSISPAGNSLEFWGLYKGSLGVHGGG